MDSILIFSILVEAITIFSSLIFIFLLVFTRILSGKEFLFAQLLLANVIFITLFYLLINLNYVNLALFLIWLFVPSTISLGYFFYLFNSNWLHVKFTFDPIIKFIPILVFFLAICLEIFIKFYPSNEFIKVTRIVFTESVMKYVFPIFTGMLILLNWVKLKKTEVYNMNSFSSDEVVNLNWSRVSLFCFSLFYFGMIFSEIVNETVSEILFNLSLLLFVSYLGYYQIRLISRYLNITKIKNNEQNTDVIHTKNVDSLIHLNTLFNELNEVVDSKLLYLKQDLSLQDLSQIMKLNPKYLSQAINSQNELNFNKYINEKRVSHACKLLKDPAFDGFTFESIANDSGFRSKSTFNSAFKSIMGCTPSTFKNLE